ncbi:hypothetical protein MJ390_16695 [Klebsiella pneumoniae]|nr:hypothetical protein MJ390_16695 [Klebsiella pneumoniae]
MATGSFSTGILTTDSTDPVEMRLFLRCQGEAISETWLYQHFPPAADKRNYVDDRIPRNNPESPDARQAVPAGQKRAL